MITVTRWRVATYFTVGLSIQALLRLLKSTRTHYERAFFTRLAHFVGIETLMLAYDVLIWNRLTQLLHGQRTRAQVRVIVTFNRHLCIVIQLSTLGIKLSDSLRAVLVLFILLAHTCFALFYTVQVRFVLISNAHKLCCCRKKSRTGWHCLVSYRSPFTFISRCYSSLVISSSLSSAAALRRPLAALLFIWLL